MATFNNLPMELLIEILTIAVNESDTTHLPTIGVDASFFLPYSTRLDLRGVVQSTRAKSITSTKGVASVSTEEEPIRPAFGLRSMAKSLRL
jgi:hypothetical protein